MIITSEQQLRKVLRDHRVSEEQYTRARRNIIKIRAGLQMGAYGLSTRMSRVVLMNPTIKCSRKSRRTETLEMFLERKEAETAQHVENRERVFRSVLDMDPAVGFSLLLGQKSFLIFGEHEKEALRAILVTTVGEERVKLVEKNMKAAMVIV